MTIPTEDFKWLPEALDPVALRLARADAFAFQIGDLATKWSMDGPLGFEQVRRDGLTQMVVKSLRPVPPEASLLFSEAVNHLRAAVDNAFWHLTEKAHGSLSGSLAAMVSMPIVESQEDLDRWTGRRNKIPALRPETRLGQRLRALQPFVDIQSSVPSMGELLAAILRVEVESAHPLRLLQAYSNADKHRSIRLAAGRTFSSSDAVPLEGQDLSPKELKVGDPIGPSSRWGRISIVETNTAVMVQRPEPFSAWVNPVKELNAMRRHLSQIVVPILLTGLEMPKGLPPSIQTGASGETNRERLCAGGWADAEERLLPLVRTRFHEAERIGVQFAPVVDDLSSTTKPG